jgi:acid phosphatase type 7
MGMRKPVLLLASMASAVMLACMAAVLTAVPGAGQTTTATLVGAGDIAGCYYTADSKTAALLANIPGTVYTLGDNVYPEGTAKQFRNCYDPTWGKYKRRTKPTPGNHEYHTEDAKPYFNYFGARAGRPSQGYYSYDRGSWHIVALNSNCSEVGGCGLRSPQGRWLREDLATNPARCTLAYFHHPLYTSAFGAPSPEVSPFWKILYRRDADVILSGHAHRYERHAPQTPGGVRNRENGIRQFVVGTGGNDGGDDSNPATAPNLQVLKTKTPGVLKLNLGAGTYHWKFVPIAGRTFTDSGDDECH